MEKLMTVKDVADFLRMSKEKVYKMAQEGKIPVIKIENQWRFRQDRLHLWLETKEIGIDHLPPRTLPQPAQAAPFLKWAGGKSQLLPQYDPLFPPQFNNYIEPFVGAGAVFFHLFNSGKLSAGKKVLLIDTLDELINCYRVIQDMAGMLIDKLKDVKFSNNEAQYYRIRSEHPADPVDRAARMIYLNKTCFNGLFRVNRQGKFNVPFGRYSNPLICDAENILAAQAALKNVRLLCDDFSQCLQLASPGDFIYLDPPYQPVSKTSNFTGYTKDAFGNKDQERLADTFRRLDNAGCRVMLSNSDTPLVKKLYDGFRIDQVTAKRAINSKSAGRGQITELVIRNY